MNFFNKLKNRIWRGRYRRLIGVVALRACASTRFINNEAASERDSAIERLKPAIDVKEAS